MTTFPYYKDLETAKKDSTVAEPQWQHNWLYSVVPVSERLDEYDNRPAGVTSHGNVQTYYSKESYFPLGAYLTGFCRECRKAFSAPIPCDASGYVETQLSIPVYGCVGPK